MTYKELNKALVRLGMETGLRVREQMQPSGMCHYKGSHHSDSAATR